MLDAFDLLWRFGASMKPLRDARCCEVVAVVAIMLDGRGSDNLI